MQRTKEEELVLAALRGELPEPSDAEIAAAQAAEERRVRRRRAVLLAACLVSLAALLYGPLRAVFGG